MNTRVTTLHLFPIEEEELIIFDMYYAGIVSMNLHPGTTRDPPSQRTLTECANIALDMLAVRRGLIINSRE